MKLLWRKICSFLSIKNREKLWFFLLFILSGFSRAAVLTLPFRRVAPYLGRHFQNTQLAALVSEKQLRTAWRIGRITELTAAYTPWQSKCLIQAMMAKFLLSYYDIPYVMYLGVTKSAARAAGKQDANNLQAHAWLTVGPWVITGREGHRAFTIVSTFVTPSLLESPPG